MPLRPGWLLPSGQTRQTTRLTDLGAVTPVDPLVSRSGILPGSTDGTYRVSGLRMTDSGPMTATVHAGRALVQGRPEQGAYAVTLDGDTVLTFGDGDPLQPRIDLVVLRVYDDEFDSLTRHEAVLEVLVGQPSATPSAPPVPAASLPLFTVRVKAGTSAGSGGVDWAKDLTDLRTTVASVGGILPVYNNAGVPGSYPGQYQDNDNAHQLQRWSGTGWVAYPKEIGGVAPQGALTVGGYTGQYREHNGVLQRWNGTTWATYHPPVETEAITAGALALANWTLVSYDARRTRGGLCTMSVTVTRSGAQVDANSAGNIVNDEQLCTLPSGWRPALSLEASAADGYGSGSAMISSGGTVTLRTWSSNGALVPGRNVRVSATYILP
ncbi:hypothetical protein [Streptomyces sp. NPDC058486]|uniref:hypothetical protein n=1 Tax=unclassified Streptomyces TaxID=2593676 RepID=UPI00365C1A8A